MFLVKRFVGLRVLYIYSFAFNLVELGRVYTHSRPTISPRRHRHQGPLQKTRSLCRRTRPRHIQVCSYKRRRYLQVCTRKLRLFVNRAHGVHSAETKAISVFPGSEELLSRCRASVIDEEISIECTTRPQRVEAEPDQPENENGETRWERGRERESGTEEEV